MSYLSRRDYKVSLGLLAAIAVLTNTISLPLLLYPWDNTGTSRDLEAGPGNSTIEVVSLGSNYTNESAEVMMESQPSCSIPG